MKKIIVASSLVLASQAFADSAIVDSIKNGKVSGNIRAYNVYQDRKGLSDTNRDLQAFALGGKLHAENASIMGFNAGLSFYSVNDMGLVSRKVTRTNTLYKPYAGATTAETADFSVLGESYINYSGYGVNLRTGAQEVNTPFLNPSDAQIIPATYKGHMLSFTGVENLKLSALVLNKFKARTSASFNNMGSAYGVGATKGAMVGGAEYSTKEMKATAYYYSFNDIMNLSYAAGSFTFAAAENLSVTPSLQYAGEKGAGSKLVGDIGASVLGANVNVTSGDLKVDVAYATAKEDTSKYQSGSFYSKMTYFTDPLFTNSMTHGMAISGVDSGTAISRVGSSYKVTANYTMNSDLSGKVSYANYDYKTNSQDRSEIDFDVTYKFSSVPGLSYTNRLAKVSSDTETNQQTQWRAQLQMTF
jgi:hypothetical protein